MPIILIFSNAVYSWDDLPIRELRLHPLVEYKKNNFKYSIAKILEIRRKPDKTLCENTNTKEQIQFIIKCKIIRIKFI